MPCKYEAIDPSPFSANQRILAMVLDPCCVLDVGCATGYLASELARRGCRVFGIEQSPEAAAQAAKPCESVWTADLDAFDLPPCDLLFDCMIFADILEHTRDPAGNLRKLLPRLRPGGRIICSLPNVANWRVRFALLFGRFDYTALGILDETHLRFFTARSARRMFADLGLAVERFTVTPSFLPYRLYKLYPLKWLDYALCRILPGLGAQQLVFELRRMADR